MIRSQPSIAMLGALLIAGAAPFAAHRAMGGWAVTTVQDLPDYIVAGKALTLTYTVRQHGLTLLNGLKPEVEARAGGTELRVMGAPGKSAGQYVSTVTLPTAGAWTITIKSGFGNSGVTLEPIQVIEAGARALVLNDQERWHRLFIAKGCVTCHRQIQVGPDLTNRQYPVEYLKQLLADPKGTLGKSKSGNEMPNLNLNPQEIAALASYVGSVKQAAAR